MDLAPLAGARLWAWFGPGAAQVGAWLLTGAAWALSLVAILSIGLFVIPLAIVATVLLARRTSWRLGFSGLIAGPGAPLIYVAYLNRAGPGNVCTAVARGTSCMQEFDPLPWLIVGLALVAAGVAAFLIRTRSQPRI
jgi:hypothetical protein